MSATYVMSGKPTVQAPVSIWNGTVARLTYRSLLGRRRALFLFALPVLLLVISAVVRALTGADDGITKTLLTGFAVSTMVPLIGVIVGTGAIATEIDDGSIVYLLAKPIRRSTIVLTKLWVAMGVSVMFAAIPTFFAGIILDGNSRHLAVAFGIAAVIASVAYSAIFLLLGVVTRHAVIAGLVYALVWESLIGNLVPGADTLSVQQWALAVAAKMADGGAVTSQVGLPTAVVFLVVVTVATTWFAIARLRSLKLAGEE
jgi:ABC-2 type transport system permease protein